MKILIVGAGAVGTVYGRYFQMGGADVSFLVRPKYTAFCKKGFRFYSMNQTKRKREKVVEIRHFDILTEIREVVSQNWDYVVLTMSSTALRGQWLDELIQVMGNAVLVTLQPGIEDREYILKRLNQDRLIEGMIPIVSYLAPLPGEKVPTQGFSYWLPPGASGPFSGSKNAVKTLVHVLRRGGFPARVSHDVRKDSLIPTTIVNILVIVLEMSDWSFKKLGGGYQLKIGCQAISEAFQVAVVHRGTNLSPLGGLFLRPTLFRFLLWMSGWVVPFDFETYLKAHFTKVKDQMHQSLRDYKRLAYEHSISVPALSLLQTFSDLSPVDQRSINFDWSGFEVVRVTSPQDPLFQLVYQVFWDEFGSKVELEQRVVLEKRFSWNPSVIEAGYSKAYEIVVVLKDGQVVAACDYSVIIKKNSSKSSCLKIAPSQSLPETVAHISHIFIQPQFRGKGLVGWLYAWPIQKARTCLADAGLSLESPVTLVAEVEPEDPGQPDQLIRVKRLKSYGQAGFFMADPKVVDYLQPDFRSPVAIDESGGPKPLNFRLLVRRVGREREREMTGAQLQEIVLALYHMYGSSFRQKDMRIVLDHWQSFSKLEKGSVILIEPVGKGK